MLGNALHLLFFQVLRLGWGVKRYRIGRPGDSPVHQVAGIPFTAVHYPSTQNLAYQDSRNLNRMFPGRADGNLTERTAYAISELIRREKIDMTIDVHEASLGYPVVSTYVCHQRADEMCMMASMMLSAEQFPMKTETSPNSLRGLTHREVGDFTNSFAVLMETPEPFIEKFAGPMTEELMLNGLATSSSRPRRPAASSTPTTTSRRGRRSTTAWVVTWLARPRSSSRWASSSRTRRSACPGRPMPRS